jgi:hypothetical protein
MNSSNLAFDRGQAERQLSFIDFYDVRNMFLISTYKKAPGFPGAFLFTTIRIYKTTSTVSSCESC